MEYRPKSVFQSRLYYITQKASRWRFFLNRREGVELIWTCFGSTVSHLSGPEPERPFKGISLALPRRTFHLSKTDFTPINDKRLILPWHFYFHSQVQRTIRHSQDRIHAQMDSSTGMNIIVIIIHFTESVPVRKTRLGIVKTVFMCRRLNQKFNIQMIRLIF